jgi:hypothetical protein
MHSSQSGKITVEDFWDVALAASNHTLFTADEISERFVGLKLIHFVVVVEMYRTVWCAGTKYDIPGTVYYL